MHQLSPSLKQEELSLLLIKYLKIYLLEHKAQSFLIHYKSTENMYV